MKQAPLDTATALAAQIAVSRARRDGRDIIEALHSEGLLASPAQVRKTKLEALTAFRQSFESWQPREYLRKISKPTVWTPDDMHTAIRQYLSEYIDAFKEEQ